MHSPVARDRALLRGGVELLAKLDANVTECPLWDPERHELHFVDIYGCRIISMDWETRQLTHVGTPETVGCVGMIDARRFVAGLKSRVAVIDRLTGDVTTIAKTSESASNRL